jgi:hypothetical protein
MLIPDANSAEFFHTPAGAGFVDLLINGHRETWSIRSQRFRTWLRRRHYEAPHSRIEEGTSLTVANDLAVRRALEGAGVIFIDENGDGPGVRLRKRSRENHKNDYRRRARRSLH